MQNAEPISPLIPAATVILIRDKPGGVETLMLRRNRALKAFAGAWVFPGGRVDPSDAPGAPELDRAKPPQYAKPMKRLDLPYCLITSPQFHYGPLLFKNGGDFQLGFSSPKRQIRP